MLCCVVLCWAVLCWCCVLCVVCCVMVCCAILCCVCVLFAPCGLIIAHEGHHFEPHNGRNSTCCPLIAGRNGRRLNGQRPRLQGTASLTRFGPSHRRRRSRRGANGFSTKEIFHDRTQFPGLMLNLVFFPKTTAARVGLVARGGGGGGGGRGRGGARSSQYKG